LDKIIVTALLLIGGVTSSILMFNSVYPTVNQGNQAMAGMQRRISDQMKSQIEIIHGAKSGSSVLIWVKNIGAARELAVNTADLFFGPEGSFIRVPYGTGSPHWEYMVENANEWIPTATLRITIIGFSPLDPGRYFCKFVLPNGVANDYFFSW
jgi:hypothetical protein